MPPRRTALLAAGIALALGAAVAPVGRAAAAESQAALVLDASGSMWGSIEGRTKIAIARGVIADLLAERDPGAELGLLAYGHRREGDCGDIEQLVPPGADNDEVLLEAVRAIRPRGKTPVAGAIRAAAEGLAFEQRPATVILVSDGVETCGVDPCRAARELEERGVDFTAHVIGFDLEEGEEDALRCVAEETGGEFFAAKDVRSLAAAAREVFHTAALTRGTGVWLAVALAEDREPLQEPSTWRAWRRGSDGEELVTESFVPTVYWSLEPGRYRVEVEHAGLRAETRFEVTRREGVRRILGLGAGRIEVSASEGRSQRPLGDGFRWQLVDDLTGDVVAESPMPTERWLVPSGTYRVMAEYRGRVQERELPVSPGQVRHEHFGFGTGRLALRAVLTDGDRAIREPLRWEVRPVAPRDGAVGEPVAVEERATVLLELESGRYEVSGTYGDTTARLLVELGGGGIQTEILDLAAGTARVFASLPAPGGPINGLVEWSVFPLDRRDAEEPVATSRASAYSFVLPEGRYRVRARLGDRTGEGLVEVRKGRSTSLGVVLD